MEQILIGLVLIEAAVVVAGVVVSRRTGRSRVLETLVAVGVLAVVAGGLSWGAWITSIKVDADVTAVRGSRCDVRWMDPSDRAIHTAAVDCPTSGDDAVGVADSMILKAQTGVLRGTAVAHSGPVTMLARGWVPGIGTVLAIGSYQLLDRRNRRADRHPAA